MLRVSNIKFFFLRSDILKTVKNLQDGSGKEQAFDEGRQEGSEEEDRRPFHAQGVVRRQSPCYVQHQRHLQDPRQQDRGYVMCPSSLGFNWGFLVCVS